MNWTEVTATVRDEDVAGITALLVPFAESGAVVEERLGDPDDLRPQAMLPDVYLKIYVAETADTPAFREELTALVESGGAVNVDFNRLAEEDWLHAWKERYRPFRIGQRFWVQPSWQSATETQPGDVVLTLDPGIAFGTGLHETTQLCMGLLEELMTPDVSVFDVGCGSGILSIAAVKCGARTVYGVDIDPDAVRVARENSLLNQVASTVTIEVGSAAAGGDRTFDVVVANILAAILMPLFINEALLSYVKPGGWLICSGILGAQRDEFAAVVTSSGGEVLRITSQGEWIAMAIRHQAQA